MRTDCGRAATRAALWEANLEGGDLLLLLLVPVFLSRVRAATDSDYGGILDADEAKDVLQPPRREVGRSANRSAGRRVADDRLLALGESADGRPVNVLESNVVHDDHVEEGLQSGRGSEVVDGAADDDDVGGPEVLDEGHGLRERLGLLGALLRRPHRGAEGAVDGGEGVGAEVVGRHDDGIGAGVQLREDAGDQLVGGAALTLDGAL